jgi:hypothetical protein
MEIGTSEAEPIWTQFLRKRQTDQPASKPKIR